MRTVAKLGVRRPPRRPRMAPRLPPQFPPASKPKPRTHPRSENERGNTRPPLHPLSGDGPGGAMRRGGSGRAGGGVVVRAGRKRWARRRKRGCATDAARGCPDQFGLSFALWTRQAVRALIARETGVWLTLPVVGRYLRAWGFTALWRGRRATEARMRRFAHGWRTPTRRLPAKPRRTAVKSSGPTRPACPVGPITAAVLPPEGTSRSSGDRASAFRSR